MAPRRQQAYVIVFVLVVTALLSSNDVQVSALERDSTTKHPTFVAPIEPIIRNRHANVFPFHTALFPPLNIRQAIFGETPTSLPPSNHVKITTTFPNPITTLPNSYTITHSHQNPLPDKKPTISETNSFTEITSSFTPTIESFTYDKPLLTNLPNTLPIKAPFAYTTTLIVPGTTVTSIETSTKTLFSTKTVIQDYSFLAKIIPFDRAATANPECKLEVSTRTLSTEFAGECQPKTTTLKKNVLLTATKTVTGGPVTETQTTTLINTKSTTALAKPHETVTKLVTVVAPTTVQKSFDCVLNTVYETVAESLPDFVGSCPFLQTTVTEGGFSRETVTKYDKQTITETVTVNDMTACAGAETVTASATRLTVLNYDYVTELKTDRTTYPVKCYDSMVTATETVSPTATVKILQVSFIKSFETRAGSGGDCKQTVTVTPTELMAELVNEYVRLTRTVVKSSFDFVDKGTGIFVVTPTVKVTDTKTVDVTVTEIMADQFCALT